MGLIIDIHMTRTEVVGVNATGAFAFPGPERCCGGPLPIDRETTQLGDFFYRAWRTSRTAFTPAAGPVTNAALSVHQPAPMKPQHRDTKSCHRPFGTVFGRGRSGARARSDQTLVAGDEVVRFPPSAETWWYADQL
ncbi:MAG: hypothetical protein OXF01_13650 [Gemmatimonadetes bacterium]|nr:hypothetical protein [Gemmatimonadota bacterium]